MLQTDGAVQQQRHRLQLQPHAPLSGGQPLREAHGQHAWRCRLCCCSSCYCHCCRCCRCTTAAATTATATTTESAAGRRRCQRRRRCRSWHACLKEATQVGAVLQPQASDHRRHDVVQQQRVGEALWFLHTVQAALAAVERVRQPSKAVAVHTQHGAVEGQEQVQRQVIVEQLVGGRDGAIQAGAAAAAAAAAAVATVSVNTTATTTAAAATTTTIDRSGGGGARRYSKAWRCWRRRDRRYSKVWRCWRRRRHRGAPHGCGFAVVVLVVLVVLVAVFVLLLLSAAGVSPAGRPAIGRASKGARSRAAARHCPAQAATTGQW
jgi:hypothetical protein